MIAAPGRSSAGERGFTLIELLVYSALLTLVLGVVGSIFISAVTGQRRAADSAQVNQEAQLVASSVGAGVRNALSVNSPAGLSPLLVLETTDRTAAGNTICQAWLYTWNDKTIHTLTRPAGAAKMTAADLRREGALLATDIHPLGMGTLTVDQPSRTVSLAFEARRGDAVQGMTTTFTSRQPVPATSQPRRCF